MSHPPYNAALLTHVGSPLAHPCSSIINDGMTGMMIPQPVTSINKVAKINPMAGRFDIRADLREKYSFNLIVDSWNLIAGIDENNDPLKNQQQSTIN